MDSSQPAKSALWSLWPSWMTNGIPDPFNLFAGQALNQPINPGWAFGNVISVTEENSSAPDTERQIVAAESYGRQLGRIIDALAVLIAERPRAAPHAKALEDVVALRRKIEEIKLHAAARRLERIGSDLALLKKENAGEYRRLAAALRQALEENS
jgi:hypothetical protein